MNHPQWIIFFTFEFFSKYAILLTAIVVLQVSAAIAGFSISACRSKEIITDTLTSIIQSYDHNDTTSKETIDWIQTKVTDYLSNDDQWSCSALWSDIL